jgi:hypothetical protein
LLLITLAFFLYRWFMLARALHESCPVRERPFEASLWKSPIRVEYGRTTRSEMIKDVLATRSFHGWTRQQVQELLGPGEPAPLSDNRWDFVYYLGADRSFLPIDNEWLGFRLSPIGTVKEYGTFVD